MKLCETTDFSSANLLAPEIDSAMYRPDDSSDHFATREEFVAEHSTGCSQKGFPVANGVDP